jgi:fatty-acyl-CoA synthase
MKGLMQELPLTLPMIFRRAARESGPREVVTAPDLRSTWAEVAARSLRLCRALERLGIERGEVVGTFAWNTHRHLELLLGVPCAGRVFHGVNFRLHHDEIAHIVNHARDAVLFVDASLTEKLEPIRSRLTGVRTFVVMEDGAEPAGAFAADPRYEDLLAGEPPEYAFPEVAESDASVICYTSGTTGHPKGVVFSHRSTVLHAIGELGVDAHCISATDTVLSITPMFHVASWGLPYTSALAGAKLVLAGADTSPQALARLYERERVTVTAGVPTFWARFVDLLDQGGYDLSSLRRVLCGGAPMPDALARRYAEHGIEVRRAWGMTEMSPSGTMEYAGTTTPQGRIVPLVELRICDAEGNELPWDGESVGEIEARGPWIASAYYEPDDDSNETRFHDGWLRTGDLGWMTPDGQLCLVDRVKDLVKSGGEWISSQALEEQLAVHPAVLEAAVVARPDPEWDERPVAFVVLVPGSTASGEDLRAFLLGRVAKWWIPDTFELVDELPKTPVGKIDKRALRARVGTTLDARA